MTQHLHFERPLPAAWTELPPATLLRAERPATTPPTLRHTGGARLGALVFAWAAFVALLAPDAAQAAQPASPLPAGSTEFVARLRAAAAQPGGGALADLTQLPFLYEGRTLDRAGFIQQVVPGLFTPRLRACLAKARPVAEDDRVTLWCKPHGLVLARHAGAWRLSEFYADGEEP